MSELSSCCLNLTPSSNLLPGKIKLRNIQWEGKKNSISWNGEIILVKNGHYSTQSTKNKQCSHSISDY